MLHYIFAGLWQLIWPALLGIVLLGGFVWASIALPFLRKWFILGAVAVALTLGGYWAGAKNESDYRIAQGQVCKAELKKLKENKNGLPGHLLDVFKFKIF